MARRAIPRPRLLRGRFLAGQNNRVTGTAQGPVNSAAPGQSGTPQVGQALAGTIGTWAGSGTVTYAWGWQRNGTDIGGTTGTGSTVTGYTLQLADDGAVVRLRVTATDSTGARTAFSSGVAVTAPALTASGSIPALVWQVGVAVNVDLSGYWTGIGTRTYSVQSGILPAGVLLNSATGVLSGTPTTQTAVASITFRAVTSGGGANQTTTREATSAPTGSNITLTFDVPAGVAGILDMAGDAILDMAGNAITDMAA